MSTSRLRQDHGSGAGSGSSAVRLTQAVHLFLRHGAEVRRLSPSTLRAYRSDLGQFTQFVLDQVGDVDVGAITSAIIEEFVASRPDLSARSVARRVSTISGLFGFLRRRAYVEVNPMEAVDRPKLPTTEAPCVTDQDAQRLLGVVVGPMERALLLTFLCAGVRRSEALALDVHDVDLRAGTLVVRCGKGNKGRTVPLTEELADALRSYLRSRGEPPDGPLFTSKLGTRLHPTSLQRMFTRWVRDAGLEGRGYSLHSLRHAAATRWIRAGLNVADVQALLGHADVGTTSRYLHSSPEHLREEMARKVRPIASPVEAPEGQAVVLTPEMARGLALLGRLAEASQLLGVVPGQGASK